MEDHRKEHALEAPEEQPTTILIKWHGYTRRLEILALRFSAACAVIATVTLIVVAKFGSK